MGKLFVLVGKSASGKDTIYSAVREDMPEVLNVVSTTTRPMRPNETEGVEYYFISTEDFLLMESRGEFIETRKYNTIQDGQPTVWYYGISKQAIDLEKGNHIVIVDLNGLEELKKVFGKNVVTVYVYVEDKEREERAKKRGGFEQAEWDRRLEDDNVQFNKERIDRDVDYIVHNINLQQSINEVKNIIDKHYN